MKVLVTGASGRLGSVTCEQLLAAGHEVRATDLIYRGDLGVKVEVADLRNLETVYRLVEGMQAVVHLANNPSANNPNIEMMFNSNAAVNMNVIHASADMDVDKIVFASSVHVINGTRTSEDVDQPSCLKYLPVDGDMPATLGRPYGLAKFMGETTLELYARTRGLSAIAVRLPWLATEEQLAGIMKGRRPAWLGGWLDEVYAVLSLPDAGRLMEAIVRTSLPGYRVYMPSARMNSSGLPIRELIERLYNGVELRKTIEELEAMGSLVDISRITEETGWEPQDP